MAKTDKEDINASLSLDEIAELEMLAEGSIKNAHELVQIQNHNGPIFIERFQVYKYASFMTKTTQIAAIFGVDKNTLAAHFKRELALGHAIGKQRLQMRFYHLAVYGNNPADRIFALKNWCGLSDAGLIEDIDDIEDGVDFKIRRPAKPVITEAYLDRNETLYPVEEVPVDESVDDETA